MLHHGNYKTPSLTSHHLQQSKVLHRFDRFQSDNLTKKHLLEPPFLNRHVKNHHSRKNLSKLVQIQGKSSKC